MQCRQPRTGGRRCSTQALTQCAGYSQLGSRTEEVWSWWRPRLGTPRAVAVARRDRPGARRRGPRLLDTVGPALSQVRRAKAERKLSMRAEIRLTEVRGSAAQVAPCADGQRAAVGSSGSSCDPIPAATRASRARSDIWATPCVSDVAKDLAALDGRAQNGEHLPALGDRGRGDAPRGGRELQTLHEAHTPTATLIPLNTATRPKRVSSSTVRVGRAQRASGAGGAR
jgi:hypothetical protein